MPKKTGILDAAGVGLLSAFVYFVWPPLVLLVIGAACLLASWQMTRQGGGEQ